MVRDTQERHQACPRQAQGLDQEPSNDAVLTADDVVAIDDAEDPSRACPEHGRDADIYGIAMSVAEGVLDVTRLAERLKVFAVPAPPLPSASDDDPPETIDDARGTVEALEGGH